MSPSVAHVSVLVNVGGGDVYTSDSRDLSPLVEAENPTTAGCLLSRAENLVTWGYCLGPILLCFLIKSSLIADNLMSLCTNAQSLLSPYRRHLKNKISHLLIYSLRIHSASTVSDIVKKMRRVDPTEAAFV